MLLLFVVALHTVSELWYVTRLPSIRFIIHLSPRPSHSWGTISLFLLGILVLGSLTASLDMWFLQLFLDWSKLSEENLDPVELNLDERGQSNTGFRTEHKMTKEQQNDVTEPSLLVQWTLVCSNKFYIKQLKGSVTYCIYWSICKRLKEWILNEHK